MNSPIPDGEAAPSRGATRMRRALPAAVVVLVLGFAIHSGSWNSAIMLWLHSRTSGTVDQVFWSSLTLLGFGWPLVILCLAVDRRGGLLTAMLPFIVLSSGLVSQVFKRLAAIPRPGATGIVAQIHVIGQPITGSTSMPSGHAVALG